MCCPGVQECSVHFPGSKGAVCVVQGYRSAVTIVQGSMSAVPVVQGPGVQCVLSTGPGVQCLLTRVRECSVCSQAAPPNCEELV